MLDLSESREKIDAIDEQIVGLFEERMKITNDVAQYKIKTGKAVLDREREGQKHRALQKLTHTDFNAKAIHELYEQIMSVSRKYQYGLINKMMPDTGDVIGFEKVDKIDYAKDATVYYFGTRGTYTQAAMEEIFGTQVKAIHEPTFRGVMEAVRDGLADFGVLPIENSSTGGVTANYDSILEYPNAIVGQHVMRIRQCLVGLPGAHLNEIRNVYSHPQGLMQCREFLERHPDMCGIEYDSTAAGAKKVRDDGDLTQAAIASERAAKEYGLEVLASDIQTDKDNSTRFIILSPDCIYTDESNKISLCIELPHVSGSLYRILSHFLFNDLNLTLIESRPIPGSQWEYRFFIDVEGNLEDPAVKNALRGIKEEAALLRILGNYKSV
ncbi:MAG: prephenate dehydratase [Eubacterium sp.]|nr:prephenate dehydratase [Eubacterium sp.]